MKSGGAIDARSDVPITAGTPRPGATHSGKGKEDWRRIGRDDPPGFEPCVRLP
jgi:hypothetical protein